jgi:hypothetical protein
MHHVLPMYTESRRATVDVFLKASGYLDCAIRQVLPQISSELRRQLPVDLAEGNLKALSLQALGQVQFSGLSSFGSFVNELKNCIPKPNGHYICCSTFYEAETFML